MPISNSLQQAWQWLVPPAVDDGAGQLIPRKQLSSPLKRPSTLPQLLEPVPQELMSFESIQPLALIPYEEDAIDIDVDADTNTDIAGDEANMRLPVHPDASHRSVLQNIEVFYRLRRSRRKSIGFSVGGQGLDVAAPQWVGLSEIEAALQSKAAWIVRKLQAAGHREAHKAQSKIEWRDGGVLDYLGKPLTLRLSSEHLPTRQTHREQAADGAQSLYLPLLPGAGSAQIRAAVQAWILREARNHFTARLLHFTPLVGVRWSALRLTSARTRWGSANSDGVIRLNWRLLQHSPQVIDYVVVHELAHLHHMDHSPQFWSEVAKVLPDWKSQRNRLKNHLLPAWE